MVHGPVQGHRLRFARLRAHPEPRQEKSLVATTLWALPSLREPLFDMKALLHFFEVAPRWDRQILTIAMCSSVLLLVLGATAELIAL
jgi:hypothetical protein